MLLQLDFSIETPIYMQIRNQIVLGIAQGKLQPGERLPTIRALADDAGINMMTASKAYQLLKQEGYILTDRRSGAIISGAQAGKKQLDEKTLSALRLSAGEAKLSGLSKEAFAGLCGRLYEEMEAGV